ncbi:MAG: response regulator [Candidatus Paceibacterota bacterium]|jgi:DNA-binding response OmpR family regulator
MNNEDKKIINNTKKILVVEDDLSLLSALKDKLTREGFSIFVAKNGIEGLELVLNNKPDLIMLDLLMPKMDGITMLKNVREYEWGEKVPVIILSNLSNEKLVAQTLEIGAYDYLIKSDWKIEDIIAKIKEKLV